jgi:hypothetical protein
MIEQLLQADMLLDKNKYKKKKLLSFFNEVKNGISR